MRPTLKRFPMRRRILVSAVSLCFAGVVAANPLGPTVVSGNANFSSSGRTLTVTNSPGAIIDWQRFNIDAGEMTRFVQQNSASAVLNRVIGGDPSVILGALQSNGRVFLINPNGITFGEGAQVDVAGLVASTLNLSNSDFLAGRLRLAGQAEAGGIANHGNIRAAEGGQILLIASGIENSGVISAPNGDVLLAAGKTIRLVDVLNPEIQVEVTAPVNQVVNLGAIAARNIGLFGGTIRHSGTVSANAVEVDDHGRILFRATKDVTLEADSQVTANGAAGGQVRVQSTEGDVVVLGKLEATGSSGPGGQVEVLGNRVAVTGHAQLDVSGATGGGVALVGGDYQGRNPDVPNAQQTFLGPDARINADAGVTGSGGKAIVWADDTARAHGSISARGGADSGNGGLVETSGHHLDVAGIRIDTSAANGLSGTWLLDPYNVVINSSTTSSGAWTSYTFVPSGSPSNVNAADIKANLDGGNNVTITTSVYGGAEPGDITVLSPVTWGTANTLTLSAAGSIAIDAAITGSAGTLELIAAGGGVSQTQPIKVTKLWVDAAGSVLLNSAANAVSLIEGNIAAAASPYSFKFLNTVPLQIGANGITIGLGAYSYTSSSPAGIIFVRTTTGDISQAGPLGGAAVLAQADTGSVILDTVSNGTGIVAGYAARSFAYRSVNPINVTGVLGTSGVSAPNIFLSSSGAGMSVNAPVNAGGRGTVTLSAYGSISGSGRITAGSLNLDAGMGSIGPLSTTVVGLRAFAVGPIYIANTGPLSIPVTGGTGGEVPFVGGMPAVQSFSGDIVLSSVGGFSVAGGIEAPSGSVYLTASNNGNLVLLPESWIIAGNGVWLTGGTVTAAGSITNASLAKITPTITLTLPTLSQCIADSTLAGCSTVLPSLDTCISAPTTLGCSVVLPSLATCTVAPTTPGCSVVLPSLSVCMSAPTTSGCEVVLPTLATCIAAPSTLGCSAVLPSLSTCLATPTTPGCDVVLSLADTCAVDPTASECSVLQPPTNPCTANPTLPGCPPVLPTLTQCIANPTLPGCSSVLPTYSQCLISPTLPGCSAVLPTLTQCVDNPSLDGCSIVLPTLAQCLANSTLPGCSVVLPTAAQCQSDPTLPGCQMSDPELLASRDIIVLQNDLQPDGTSDDPRRRGLGQRGTGTPPPQSIRSLQQLPVCR